MEKDLNSHPRLTLLSAGKMMKNLNAHARLTLHSSGKVKTNLNSYPRKIYIQLGRWRRIPGRPAGTLFRGARLRSSLTCPQQELEGFSPGLLTPNPDIDGHVTTASSDGFLTAPWSPPAFQPTRKRSDTEVLCTFWLRNVLRAKTARAFPTCQLQKVFQSWCALYILTWKCASRHNSVHFFDISTSKSLRTWEVFSFFTCKCASRHNGVQFFISHLPRWLRTRLFSEPTFRPSAATSHWKTQWIATFLPFRAPASSFFSLFLFSDLLSSALLLSDSSHLLRLISKYMFHILVLTHALHIRYIMIYIYIYYIILYYIILYYIILCYVMLYYIILYYIYPLYAYSYIYTYTLPYN